jgi:hypothetical protein
MLERTSETTYRDALMGWYKGNTVIIPDVPRATVRRRARMVRELLDMAGQAIKGDPTDDQLSRDFARVAGRYAHVEIVTYNDGTWAYTTPSSGGMGQRGTLRIVSVTS